MPRYKNPRIGQKPVNGFFHTLLNGRLVIPSKRAYFLCIKVDKGVVSNPASCPSCKFQAGRNTQPGTYPADGVFNRAVGVCAEIINVITRGHVGPDAQHGFNAILNVQIAFALVAPSARARATPSSWSELESWPAPTGRKRVPSFKCSIWRRVFTAISPLRCSK